MSFINDYFDMYPIYEDYDTDIEAVVSCIDCCWLLEKGEVHCKTCKDFFNWK